MRQYIQKLVKEGGKSNAKLIKFILENENYFEKALEFNGKHKEAEGEGEGKKNWTESSCSLRRKKANKPLNKCVCVYLL